MTAMQVVTRPYGVLSPEAALSPGLTTACGLRSARCYKVGATHLTHPSGVPGNA